MTDAELEKLLNSIWVVEPGTKCLAVSNNLVEGVLKAARRLLAEKRKLVEALQFYADGNGSSEEDETFFRGDNPEDYGFFKPGEKARAVLAELEGDRK